MHHGMLADHVYMDIVPPRHLRLLNYLATVQIQSPGPDEKWLMVVGKTVVKGGYWVMPIS